MQVYHTDAPDSRPAQHRLHPKTQFVISGDTLRRTINDNARLLVHTPVVALAVPVSTLLEAERRGVVWVVLTDERGRTYRAPILAFWRRPSFEVDRGYGVQRALPLSHMRSDDEPEPAIQCSLFEVTT